jgi:prepilin-type N-terminal cleavage/methylation domain-containing protein
MNKKSEQGFTLLEILLVVAAIAILAGIVILAINPNKQLGDTRDAQRRMDVNTILNGVYQYSLVSGSLPSTINATSSTSYTCDELKAAATAATSTEICRTGLSGVGCEGRTDLGVLYASETYLTAIPHDPQVLVTATGTGYYIVKSLNNRVTVCSPESEQTAEIRVTR